MPNLVTLTRSSSQIFDKTQMEVVSYFRIFGQSLIKKIAITTETVMMLTLNLDQKLSLTRQTKQRQQKLKLTMTSSPQTVTSLPFFQFTVNLEQSGRRIPDA